MLQSHIVVVYLRSNITRFLEDEVSLCIGNKSLWILNNVRDCAVCAWYKMYVCQLFMLNGGLQIVTALLKCFVA